MKKIKKILKMVMVTILSKAMRVVASKEERVAEVSRGSSTGDAGSNKETVV